MDLSTRSLRKAAVLVASLEEHEAAALLRQMSPQQASLLREQVEQLGAVDAAEQNEVLEEFFRVGPLVTTEDSAGIELDTPLASSLGSLAADGPAADGRPAGEVPFRCLDEATPEKLAPFLERERPQTIAVVLSHLTADRGAAVLANLPAELQAEVARRLVDLEETDAEVLRDVEAGLAAWLGSDMRGQQRQKAGLAALSGMLGAADLAARHEILANLARHDRRLADQLDLPVAPPLSFADLGQLDSASLGVVLAHAPHELLVLALVAAAPSFVERATQLLGPDRAAPLQQALCNLGPTRLSDVEEAQRQLADLARQLERRGEIAPEIRRRLSVAV